jgi:hypothetical protein
MIAICTAQKSRKHSHSGQGLPAIRPAFSHSPPVSLDPRAKMPLPPIQVWMPNHPQATAARISAGTLAPRSPKEARASTGKGIPYLGPACPVASIGSSTMTLASAIVKTACFQSMPRATRPEARVQLGMQCAMEIHSAAKLYVVHVRSATGTGRRSSLAKGLSAGKTPGLSSIRPSVSADWDIGGPVGTVSVMSRPIDEAGRERPCGWRRGDAGSGCRGPLPGEAGRGRRQG